MSDKEPTVVDVYNILLEIKGEVVENRAALNNHLSNHTKLTKALTWLIGTAFGSGILTSVCIYIFK